MTATHETLQKLFVTGLVNIHAVEKQALAIASPQVARLEHYPELADRIRLHIDETDSQIARAEEALAQFDTSASRLKDTALSMSGSMAAITHSIAGDEVLKNSYANYAFEHFEIASYRSLLTLAEDGGFDRATPLLQQSLSEEEAMAQWLGDALPTITRRYAALYAEEGVSTAKA